MTSDNFQCDCWSTEPGQCWIAHLDLWKCEWQLARLALIRLKILMCVVTSWENISEHISIEWTLIQLKMFKIFIETSYTGQRLHCSLCRVKSQRNSTISIVSVFISVLCLISASHMRCSILIFHILNSVFSIVCSHREYIMKWILLRPDFDTTLEF